MTVLKPEVDAAEVGRTRPGWSGSTAISPVMWMTAACPAG
jgi:hypothetical protein